MYRNVRAKFNCAIAVWVAAKETWQLTQKACKIYVALILACVIFEKPKCRVCYIRKAKMFRCDIWKAKNVMSDIWKPKCSVWYSASFKRRHHCVSCRQRDVATHTESLQNLCSPNFGMCDIWKAKMSCVIFEKPKCSGVIFEKPKMWCVIFESQNIQCDILQASNDDEHSGVSLFSGEYILPISP
jgi:hypothetical protein